MGPPAPLVDEVKVGLGMVRAELITWPRAGVAENEPINRIAAHAIRGMYFNRRIEIPPAWVSECCAREWLHIGKLLWLSKLRSDTGSGAKPSPASAATRPSAGAKGAQCATCVPSVKQDREALADLIQTARAFWQEFGSEENLTDPSVNSRCETGALDSAGCIGSYRNVSGLDFKSLSWPRWSVHRG